HMTPEALMGGNIAKIRTGDLIRFDSVSGAPSCTCRCQNRRGRFRQSTRRSFRTQTGARIGRGFGPSQRHRLERPYHGRRHQSLCEIRDAGRRGKTCRSQRIFGRRSGLTAVA
ncbi:hypothetical protein ELQ18_10230, partial [Neisseria meningitidis]|nr:hypothetical protein [Neisseria meningitidis]